MRELKRGKPEDAEAREPAPCRKELLQSALEGQPQCDDSLNAYLERLEERGNS